MNQNIISSLISFCFIVSSFLGLTQNIALNKNNAVPYLFGDLNNDGNIDVITAETSLGTLNIYINNGNSFNSPVAIDVPSYLQISDQRLNFADFDGNGFKDLLVTNTYGSTCGNNSVRIYWNSGIGNFFTNTDYTNFSLNNPYCSSGIGVNGDNNGLRDVFVTTMGFSGNLKPQMAWKNLGSKSFSSVSTISLLRDMYGPIEGDFNNDGNSDLIFIRDNWTGGTAGYHTLFGNGNHSYNTPHIEYSTTSMQTLASIKLKPLISNKDFAVIKTATQAANQYIIAEWTGSSFQHTSKLLPVNSRFLAVLDANQDGYEDVLAVLDSNGREYLIPFLNDGMGILTRSNSIANQTNSKTIIRVERIGNNLKILSETTDSLFVGVSNAANCNIPITFISETKCSSYISPSGNYTWTTTGTYYDTLQSVGGCDSVVQINLVINSPSMTMVSDTGVNYYLWQLNNKVLTVSGNYSDTITNTDGCDSIIQLNLTILSKASISLIANDSIICNGENSSINISIPQTILDSSFTIKINTENPGITGNNQFKLSGALGSYSLIAIDSASGTEQKIDSIANDQTITFSNGSGVYYLKITPLKNNPIHKIQFFSNTDNLKLLDVLQWGNITWSTMSHMFNSCENLTISAIDIPNLSQVSNMQYMFFNCKKLNGPQNIDYWDVSGVTTMLGMFRGASLFNQPLNNWDVSGVKNVSWMFGGATRFNQDIGNWVVSNVTDMQYMFYLATSFNKNIANWDVSGVTNMSRMFSWAASFNQSLAFWDVSSVIDMSSMFDGALSFNQDLNSWDVSSVTNFSLMFWNATNFNGVISSWNTTNAVNMNRMFYGASSFNQNIGQWDVSSVTDMTEMFTGTSAFNQDLSGWCVTNITAQPSNFSTNSALTAANHPVWGVCPSNTTQYPTGTVHCNGTPTAIVDVTNPITGKTWMDRNLGASQAATSPTDAAAYGDLYQWGRRADGHQCRNSTTTTTLSSTDQPTHGDFITVNSGSYDWRNPQNTNLWQGVNGVNNPCPSGYRLPTETELNAERLSWSSNNSAGAFASPLKLPMAGSRIGGGGSLGSVGTLGDYWSSTVSSTGSRDLYFRSSNANMLNTIRAAGLSVRCLKDTPPPSGAIGALDCNVATTTGALVANTAVSGVGSSVPYTGGNGGIHSGQVVNSTGVTGLTATLTAGSFTNGAGSLTYSITGTPTSSGTASFALSIGGQSCTLALSVNAPTPTYPAGTVHCNGTPTAVVEVTNPITGRTWMDRNLGASQAATNSTDAAAYGDLYQWGRRADGHQCRNSATTSTLSSSDQPSHGDFIIAPNAPFDWRNPENSNLWQTLNAVNNPCPNGYRLPTISELDAERMSWNENGSIGAFNSPLKFPLSGGRNGDNGSLLLVNSNGVIWSGTSGGFGMNGYSGQYLNIISGGANIGSIFRSWGLAVRCIKDLPLGSIGSLDCASTINTGTLIANVSASGVTSSVPYTGGNGGSHEGQTVYNGQMASSTGVLGLYASLAAGTFANGAGSLTYSITGTPTSSGTASFALNIGGQSCTLSLSVNAPTPTYPPGTVHCNWPPTAVVEVTNPITGKTWMDRNLGASQTATSPTDAAAYGDLYQWGRRADGHQCRNSATTSTLSSTDQPSHGDFIIAPNAPFDWRSPQKSTLWQGVNGMNNPCPDGFRVPTETELSNEQSSWSINNAVGAFGSPLKFVYAGGRSYNTGNVVGAGTDFYLWSSTVTADRSRALARWGTLTGPSLMSNGRVIGSSIRCIKN